MSERGRGRAHSEYHSIMGSSRDDEEAVARRTVGESRRTWMFQTPHSGRSSDGSYCEDQQRLQDIIEDMEQNMQGEDIDSPLKRLTEKGMTLVALAARSLSTADASVLHLDVVQDDLEESVRENAELTRRLQESEEREEALRRMLATARKNAEEKELKCEQLLQKIELHPAHREECTMDVAVERTASELGLHRITGGSASREVRRNVTLVTPGRKAAGKRDIAESQLGEVTTLFGTQHQQFPTIDESTSSRALAIQKTTMGSHGDVSMVEPIEVVFDGAKPPPIRKSKVLKMKVRVDALCKMCRTHSTGSTMSTAPSFDGHSHTTYPTLPARTMKPVRLATN